MLKVAIKASFIMAAIGAIIFAMTFAAMLYLYYVLDEAVYYRYIFDAFVPAQKLAAVLLAPLCIPALVFAFLGKHGDRILSRWDAKADR